ncbi:response regulator [Desulfococcaceae bacterium HSG7]|nr:response regulator [Desulfococcaceae bacterium HSG7]
MPIIKNCKIVLIDDEEGIRKITSITLEDRGYIVQTAADGEAGLRLCQETRPHIVLTDVRMPKMDGLEVLANLKKKLPKIEVIVITAFGDIETAVKALRLDASDFITKPLNDDALHTALDRAQERYISRKQVHDHTLLLEKGWARTTQDLIRTFNFQENLIESSMDGIMGCDPDGTIVTFNRSMAAMLDYPKEKVISKMALDQFLSAEDADKLQNALQEPHYGGENKLYLYETVLSHRSGKAIPVQVSASVLFEQGKKSGTVYYFRNLQEIKKLEQEMAVQARILHQDKMISLGKLAASIVHEINNPLAGVLNYIRLMIRILNRGPLEADRQLKFQRYLDLVEKEIDRCSKLLSSLLTFSRKPSSAFTQVDVNDLLERCILLSQHKLELQRIKLETRIDAQIHPVNGDYNQLQQCVINLIFNAVDAMPDGGFVSLQAGHDMQKEIVTIAVRDSGSGIDEKDLPRIFEPFFTTKQEGYGVGLGLSTVYGIIKNHKGIINASSPPGEGAVFTIELPFVSNAG